jgi:hypothetical protein
MIQYDLQEPFTTRFQTRFLVVLAVRGRVMSTSWRSVITTRHRLVSVIVGAGGCDSGAGVRGVVRWTVVMHRRGESR